MIMMETVQYNLMVMIGKRNHPINPNPAWFGKTDTNYKTLKAARSALKNCQKHPTNKNYTMWIEKATTKIERIE